MFEPTFVALRELLEGQAHQPAFDVIRSRRRRRTRGQATIAGVMVLTMAVAIGTAFALSGAARHQTPPIGPQPTPTPRPDVVVPTIEALAVSPSGLLYALASTCVQRESNCDRPTARHLLLVSRDLAATWSPVGDAPAGGQLLNASESQWWINGQTTEILADGTVVGRASPNPGRPAGRRWTTAASADGGHTWQSWELEAMSGGGAGLNRNELHLADHAGSTAWFTQGPHVYVAAGVTRPARTASQPPGFNNIFQLAAIDTDHAVLMGSANNTAPAVWFETSDRGATWARIGDPCAGTPQAGSIFSSMSVAPDGSWWVLCVSRPAMGSEPGPTVDASPGPQPWPRQVVVSTDAGRTWQRRGVLTDPVRGLGAFLFAVSTTTAWRVDSVGARLSRTVDGRSWASVAASDPTEAFMATFVAIDATTAVYVAIGDGVDPVFTVTRDGGATWTTHPLPAVSRTASR